MIKLIQCSRSERTHSRGTPRAAIMRYEFGVLVCGHYVYCLVYNSILYTHFEEQQQQQQQRMPPVTNAIGVHCNVWVKSIWQYF